MRLLICVQILLVSLVYQGSTDLSEGSKILLSSSSSSFLPSLTPTLTLRCSINDTMTSAAGAVIGRDVTHTDVDVQQVSSIIISHQGQDVATITMTTPAHPLLNASNMQVTGDLTRRPGERGYLEVTWSYPDGVNQAGEFNCEANAINDVGHNVVFSTSLGLTAREPTMTDLVQHMHDMQVAKIQYEAQTNQTIDRLQHEVDSLKHMETGVIQCGHSSVWPGRGMSGSWHTVYKDVTQVFRRPYDVTPQVKVGVEDVVTYGGADTRLGSQVLQVTQTNFTIRCLTWAPGGSDTGGIHSMGISWISVPSF